MCVNTCKGKIGQAHTHTQPHAHTHQMCIIFAHHGGTPQPPPTLQVRLAVCEVEGEGRHHIRKDLLVGLLIGENNCARGDGLVARSIDTLWACDQAIKCL